MVRKTRTRVKIPQSLEPYVDKQALARAQRAIAGQFVTRCRNTATKAMAELERRLGDPKETTANLISGIRLLCEYGYGRAPQRIEVARNIGDDELQDRVADILERRRKAMSVDVSMPTKKVGK